MTPCCVSTGSILDRGTNCETMVLVSPLYKLEHLVTERQIHLYLYTGTALESVGPNQKIVSEDFYPKN